MQRNTRVQPPELLETEEGFTILSKRVLPPCTKYLDNLTIITPPREDAKKKTSHEHDIVKKKISDTKFILKYLLEKNVNDPQKEMAMLEAVAANFCKLIVPDAVPSTHAVYDKEKDQFTAVLSAMFKNFRTARENPLHENNLVINFSTSDIIQTNRNVLEEKIKNIKTEISPKQSSLLGYFQSFYNTDTSQAFNGNLETYLGSIDPLSPSTLNQLLNCLENRRKNLDSSMKPDHEREKPLLQQAILQTKNLLGLLKKRMVKCLEEIDRDIKKRGIDLDNYGSEKDYDNLIGHVTNTQFDIDTNYTITVRNLKNYRLQKGLGRLFIARFIGEEGDFHINNFSTAGHGIDFDMAELMILFHFRYNGWGDTAFRTPTEETFAVISDEMKKWPDINRPHMGYWPTQRSTLTASVISLVAHFYDITANFFSESDNELYKKLNKCPSFMFHFHTTVLKFILTTEDMYREIAKLHLATETKFKGKNLLDAMIDNKSERINEFYTVFTKLPEFKEFLLHQGDYAFTMIQEEFHSYKEKHQKKLDKKPHFQGLVDAIDLNKINTRYYELLKVMDCVLPSNTAVSASTPEIVITIQEDYIPTALSFSRK